MAKREVIYQSMKEEWIETIDREEFTKIIQMLKAFIKRSDAFTWRVLQSKVKFPTSGNAKPQDSKQWKME